MISGFSRPPGFDKSGRRSFNDTMSSRPFYYFDNNATTQVAPEVVEAMLPFLTEYWGNPSSAYGFAHQHRRRHRDGAGAGGSPDQRRPQGSHLHKLRHREQQHRHPQRLVTTGKRHVITTAVEHSANINFCQLPAKTRLRGHLAAGGLRTARSIWACWSKPSARTRRSFR